LMYLEAFFEFASQYCVENIGSAVHRTAVHPAV
jgi:hypothetical protein